MQEKSWEVKGAEGEVKRNEVVSGSEEMEKQMKKFVTPNLQLTKGMEVEEMRGVVVEEQGKMKSSRWRKLGVEKQKK